MGLLLLLFSLTKVAFYASSFYLLLRQHTSVFKSSSPTYENLLGLSDRLGLEPLTFVACLIDQNTASSAHIISVSFYLPERKGNGSPKDQECSNKERIYLSGLSWGGGSLALKEKLLD